MNREEAEAALTQLLEQFRGKTYKSLKPQLGIKRRTQLTMPSGVSYLTSVVVEPTGSVSPSLAVVGKIHGTGEDYLPWTLKGSVGLMVSGRFAGDIKFETPSTLLSDLVSRQSGFLLQLVALLIAVVFIGFWFA